MNNVAKLKMPDEINVFMTEYELKYTDDFWHELVTEIIDHVKTTMFDVTGDDQSHEGKAILIFNSLYPNKIVPIHIVMSIIKTLTELIMNLFISNKYNNDSVYHVKSNMNAITLNATPF